MENQLRELVALGMGLLLILLRLDAERFGAAEYDEPTRTWSAGREPAGRFDDSGAGAGAGAGAAASTEGTPLSRRLAWYLIGVVLVAIAFVVHPTAHDDLHLRVGDRVGAAFGGLVFGALGAGTALAYAWFRYRRLRLPPPATYPGALLNAVGTALIDEAAFRGILMGLLLLAGVDALSANLIQTIVYVLATRLGARGRSRYMLALAIGIGLIGGWLTLVTGGIGAAFIAHVITRVGLFVATGHPGRVGDPGLEVEEEERDRRPPIGWRVVDEHDDGLEAEASDPAGARSGAELPETPEVRRALRDPRGSRRAEPEAPPR